MKVFRKAVKRLRNRLLSTYLGPPGEFLIVSQGRTGSNLLVTLLNSHPEIQCEAEIIGDYYLNQEQYRARLHSLGIEKYLDTFFRRQKLEKAVGAKILYNHVTEHFAQFIGEPGLPAALDLLRARANLKVIHLKRRNRLRTLVSWHVAAISRQYLQTSAGEGKQSITVRISPRDCEREFIKSRNDERRFAQYFAHCRQLEIYYEDLVEKAAAEHRRVQDFLEVPIRQLSSNLKKQQKRPIEEVVENYQQLQHYFAGSPWAEYFQAAPAASSAA